MLTMTRTQELKTTLDEVRWQAVQQRDRSRDGQFVLAVRTTGIYCRPSCPARMPNRENVLFFADADAAERAGFRACRRCKPRAPLAPREEMIQRATAWLEAHKEERVTLSRLAEAVGVSPAHLQRTFTAVTGVSPRQYVAARRLEGTKSSLRRGDDITTAIYAAGYGSSSRFYAQARAELGSTSKECKRCKNLRPGARGARHDSDNLQEWRRRADHFLRNCRFATRPRAGGSHRAGHLLNKSRQD